MLSDSRITLHNNILPEGKNSIMKSTETAPKFFWGQFAVGMKFQDKNLFVHYLLAVFRGILPAPTDQYESNKMEVQMTAVDERVIAKIVMECAAGEKPTDLSRKYGVAKSSIYRWLNNRTERTVETITHLSQRDFHLMLVELKRLRTDLEVYRACRCSRFSPQREKYEEIERLKDRFNIHALCRVLEVRRSSFYHYLYRSPEKTQIEIDDEFFAPKIKSIFEQSKERFGSRKIQALLQREGLAISMRRISRLMDEMNLVCKQSRLHYWSTTARKYKYYRNRLQQDFKQPAPNLVWVGDITYVRVKDIFYYICIVIDLFSRRVLAYGVSNQINVDLVWSTFDSAFEMRNRPEGLTFHSDQGSQYTDFNFRKHLRDLKVTQSFSNPGTPLDNAVAESFFACMKREELSHNFYETRDQLENDVAEYVDYYNRVRLHQKMGMRTPIEVEDDFLSKS